MSSYFIIAWRAPGDSPYFFRGDRRYQIFLPYISAQRVPKGWVRDEAYARVFDMFPVFGPKSLAKGFIADRLRIFPYEGPILPTQRFHPIKRPIMPRQWSSS